MPPELRLAVQQDLPALERLEQLCFPPDRRESRRILGRSIASVHQECWVVEEARSGPILGAMILRLHPHTMRIYSIAVDPAHSGKGYGKQLLEYAIERAIALGMTTLLLEAEASQSRLVDWYRKHGFVEHHTLRHYYSRGKHALKMKKTLAHSDPCPSAT